MTQNEAAWVKWVRREVLAAVALHALIIDEAFNHQGVEQNAEMAYKQADAMIAQGGPIPPAAEESK